MGIFFPTLLLHLHFVKTKPASSLTEVLRVDERGPALRMRLPSPDGPLGALLMLKLATDDVHLVHGGLDSLGQHARTAGVHVEPAFVADDGLVYDALVVRALIVCLRETKVSSDVQVCGSGRTFKV